MGFGVSPGQAPPRPHKPAPTPLAHTLTRQQFHQLRPQGSYEKYVAYVAARRGQQHGHPAHAGRPVDPFAPISEGSLQQRANSLYGPGTSDQQMRQQAAKLFGPGMDDQAITSAAHGQIDPILAALTKSVTDRAQTSSSQIAANSGALARDLAGTDYGAPYRGAISDQAKVDAALHAALSGAGGEAAAGLSSSLASIGEPGATGSAASAVAARGTGAANANLAGGSASLSELLSRAAAAGEYGAKQPGIARLTGLQDIAGVQRDAQQSLTDKTAEIMARLPDIVATLMGREDTRQGNKANYLESLAGRESTRRQNRASYVDSERNRMLQAGIARDSGLVDQYAAQTQRQKAGEDARRNRVAEHQKRVALNQAAAALGISAGELEARLAADSERGRHNRAGDSERARHDKAGERQQKRTAGERARHNRKAEADARARANLARRKQALAEKAKNKKGKGGKPDWGN